MEVVVDHFDLFWSGYMRSVSICLWGSLGSLILGVILAVMRILPVPPLRTAASLYVTALMNTPLAVVLFFVAFGFPELGIRTSYYVFGVGGLILYTAAFVCEAVRSGVNAVSVGQAEAAKALGLTSVQVLGNIVVPQAIRTTVPPLSNTLIAMFTNSAIVGAFGVGGDLFATSAALTGVQGYPNFPVLTGVGIGYLAITLPAAFLLRRLERNVVILR